MGTYNVKDTSLSMEVVVIYFSKTLNKAQGFLSAGRELGASGKLNVICNSVKGR